MASKIDRQIESPMRMPSVSNTSVEWTRKVFGPFDHAKSVVYDSAAHKYYHDHGGKRGQKRARDRQIRKSGHMTSEALDRTEMAKHQE